jgi:photosystem II stability/assembly factor-like uncharacterized protein
LLVSFSVRAEDPKKKTEDGLSSTTLSGLKLRALGPAVSSGRVVGLAVHPRNKSHYYVAAASGGVWKTTNAGTTWTPIFDDQGSYSIGCIVLDPKQPNTVWVGTGENNSQRSVSYGDGVYRSDDAGKTWKKMGLEKSEHIGRIVIDPRDSNTVYVAAQGPLWGPGGDRGLYKTTDGGKTWKNILTISENTGVTDVVLDSRNPDIILAASYQRRRHVWTLINGGPESALHRSTDGGASWTKLKTGLPTEEMGRIGLALAPSNPDVVYAIIEAANKKGGIFRSSDFGITWDKRNDYDQQAQYYAHLVVDPKNADRIYVMNVYIQVSDDGGKTLRRLGEKSKHVDNHTMWIDPDDNSHYLVGCDGGVYESFDRAATWKFHANLPITQFYDVAVDNNAPFYHVYGGTQDNCTLGGPARNRSTHGITNADWFVTQEGDGFHSRVDPHDPNTVYSEAQYGYLVRFDRRTGQTTSIKPQESKGEPPLRWNWDSPLIISPHAHERLYFAANKLYRSDDRGDSWKAVSPDLTRQLDRDKLPVMGKIWNADAVSKSVSTSFYGNIVALSESPKNEGLLYVGTDDGLIQVSDNGGPGWRKVDKFPGVPDRVYVSRLLASQHDAQTVYAAFDNHKNADFAPYLLRSTDAGRTWTRIQGDLPANGPVLAIAEDHVDPHLLFVGTEFGLFVSVTDTPPSVAEQTEKSRKWLRLKGGLPTIAVRDLAIQKQMDDLVLATFGRGFYVLDDYSCLRGLKSETLAREAQLFTPRAALLYVEARPYGWRGKGFQGEAFFTAENPKVGATFTYHLKDGLKTRKQRRQDAEKEAAKKGTTPPYPTQEQLRAEAEEEPPTILLTVTDTSGAVVRTITGPITGGIHRVTWNLRGPAASLPRPRPQEADEDIFTEDAIGPLVLPGTYRVALAKRVGGHTTPLGDSHEFQVNVDSLAPSSKADYTGLVEFQRKALKLERAVSGAVEVANALNTRLEQMKRALDVTPGIDPKWKETARSLEQRNRDILRALRGDVALRTRNENTPTSITERVASIVDGQRLSLARPTKTSEESYKVASEEFGEQLAKLRALIDGDLRGLEKALDAAGAPWTPGRLPEWRDK